MKNDIYKNMRNQMKPDESVVDELKNKINRPKISQIRLIEGFAAAILCLAILSTVFVLILKNNNLDDNIDIEGTDTPTRCSYGTIAVWWDQGTEDKQLISDVWYDFIAEYATKEGSKYYKNKDSINMFTVPGYQKGVTELEVQIMGGIAPDLIKMDHIYLTKLGMDQKIVDINSEFNATEEISHLFTQSTWEASGNIKTGAVYGIPFDANTLVWGGKKGMLEEAGTVLPTTYDELLSTATKLKNKNPDVYPYTLPLTDTSITMSPVVMFISSVARLGGNMLNEDNTKAIFNDPQTGVKALEMVLELKNKGLINPDTYEEGSTALYDVGTWRLNTFSEDMVFDLMPELKEGVERYSTLGLYSLAILKGSRNDELTYDFSKHFATGKSSEKGEYYQYTYAQNHSFFPSLLAAQNTDSINDPVKKEFWEVAGRQLELSKSGLAIPQCYEIADILNKAITEVMAGEKDPQTALDEAAAKADQLLKSTETE